MSTEEYEIYDFDVITVKPGDVFRECHFFECELEGCGAPGQRVQFLHCAIYFRGDMSEFVQRCDFITFTECLVYDLDVLPLPRREIL